ncbi:FG-GAP-like repeat-containing protein [Hymenobacter monticola]|uniref:FG-GAP-like repeat-containing protein n=1 Tax=Hymenobacter monticola TaxID=1705399 RepID=A0ABY4B1J0_9BACT|nr:FG-GAP-like repeat-containing protein [Hymenobacter monticola]UOE33022.1 FG-GAP-like repeat-containing protein [Hymenobacter monticola]
MRGKLTCLVSLFATAAQAQAPDVTRAGLAPAANAPAAARNTTVVVPFSQALDPSTAGNIKINATQYRGQRTATSALSNGGSTVTLTPTVPATGVQRADFKPGERVSVTVPGSVRSTANVGAAPHVYQFTTATTGGGGGFVASTTPPYRPIAMMQAATIQLSASVLGDIDGDGDLDLIHSSYVPRPGYQGGLGKYVNDGTGAFTSGIGLAITIPTSGIAYGTVNNPQLGDVDGDGDLDLLVIGSAGVVAVFPNGGDASGSNTGVFTDASARLATLPGTNAGRIVLGDVDGDGDLDLIVPVGNTVAVRLNGGDATGSNAGTFANGSDVALAAAAGSAQLGDVDGDGDLDLIVPVGNTVAVRLNGSDATGSNAGTFAGGSDVALAAAAGSAQLGDVDGDGDLDLVAATSNAVAVFLNGADATGRNSGVFTNGSTVSVSSAPGGVALSDMDGDGDLDLVAANGSAVAVLLNGGDATGSSTGVFVGSSNVTAGNNPTVLLLGDIDGDGDMDMMTTGVGSRAQILQNSPPPAPTAGSLMPASGPVGTSVVITGTNFTAGMTVMFNGTAATFVLNSATQLTAVVPAGATSGPVSITNAGGTGSSASFTVGYPSLTISAPGQTIAAGLYNNLTISSTGVATLGGAVQVLGALAVQSGGQLLTACQPLTGAGSFTLEAGATLGICDAAGISSSGATGAVQVSGARSFSPDALYTYNGTVAQVTGSGLPATVHTLTLDNGTGLTLVAPLTVTSSLALTSGVLSTGSHLLALGGTAILSESASGYVTGTVQTTRDMNAAGTANDFGGLGLTLTPAAGSPLPGSTLVQRTTGTARTGTAGRAGILRWFDIQPAVNTGLDITLTMSYREAELNGINEANLALFKSETGAADSWGLQRNASFDATANTATLAGVRNFSIWTLGNANAPLPVELNSFAAQAEGRAVKLAWATASEKNSAYFGIERSLDGLTFVKVGQVTANGNSTKARTYAYLDAGAPVGQLYYRLRQVDADGSLSYSLVRTVMLGAAEVLALSPNPTRTGTLASGLPAGAAVEVFDALGRPVLHTQADAAGQAPLTLPAGLAPGVYVVRCGAQTRRLVVE